MIKRILKTAQGARERTGKTSSREAVIAVRQKRQELTQALKELAHARKAKDRA